MKFTTCSAGAIGSAPTARLPTSSTANWLARAQGLPENTAERQPQFRGQTILKKLYVRQNPQLGLCAHIVNIGCMRLLVGYSNVYAFKNSLRKASHSNVAERVSSVRIFLKTAETRWNVSAVMSIRLSSEGTPPWTTLERAL